ncbi:hypothetical protein Patl1_16309 [Pistacia atlantica]|uniref:Uncharacterized protein n=1 Tax=Pistacia atlantica TaxID=434234 RepID=A0ACC1B684_9ROSI|nr:hypothetical protein Patl1_16309 [Pistacia atlantica]
MDSSSSASSLHLAMAALVGASLMAISAFFIHKRSVDQVLDRLIEIRRELPQNRDGHFYEEENEEEEYSEGGYDSDGDGMTRQQNRESRSLEDSMLRRYKNTMSSSLPNVSVRNDWLEEDAKFDEAIRVRAQNCSASSLDKLNFIPSGLPPLQTSHRLGEDQPFNRGGSSARLASVGILRTPRSPGGSGFENAEDSEDDGTELANEDDMDFSYEDIDSSANFMNDVDSKIQNSSAVPFRTDLVNFVQDQNCRASINVVKPGIDVHGKGKVDTASAQITGHDTTLPNIILPLRTTLHESTTIEDEEVRKMLQECLDLRKSYVYTEEVAPWLKEAVPEPYASEVKIDPFHFEPVEASTVSYFCFLIVFRNEKFCFNFEHDTVGAGVALCITLGWRMESYTFMQVKMVDTVDLFPVANSTTFFTDMHHILRIMSIGNVRSACHHRLRFLEEKFRLHLLVKADKEFLAQKGAPHRDFYNIRKVDTHVHHSACMNQKHLLRFIKSKLRKEPDEVVIFRDGKYMTLKEVFESLDLSGYDLNVDLLDVHADKSTFHRFDKFNLKYNPCGQSRLREIFLKQDNLIQGRFLAEVTKEVLLDLEASKYQMAEYRISVYGRKQSEWDQLASWFVNNEIYSENAVWLIQLPRLYNIYKQMGIVKSFQNILDNIFIPLFEVTIDPNSHPQLHLFLMQVVGFDLVDDESKPERRPTKHMPKPAEWTNDFNPAYSYYAYYCYANFYTLNKLRESKGMTTIKFRPHCGEVIVHFLLLIYMYSAGEIDHLAAGFLLCNNISHGINLRKSPVLQYLYYLAQIGLSMSPLSNNSLFLDYHRNPFPMFFQRGLNVSLSSDDPLQIHLTKEALVEEYSVAAKVWKLSACDLCEIVRNSVYQSGFSHMAKSHWLGNNYYIRGPEGNDIHKTNVPNLRIAFRHDTWKDEMQYVYLGRAPFPENIDP